MIQIVSKLFRAYGLYNRVEDVKAFIKWQFQSSFELTGYITSLLVRSRKNMIEFQSSFELTGYITEEVLYGTFMVNTFQSSFELTGYIT